MTQVDHTKALVEQLTRHEGFRRQPYRDTVGKLTIGYGRNLDDVGITREEAMHLLENDIRVTAKQLDMHLPWWRDLDAARQRVMLNWAFNIGVGGVMGFSRALAAIRRGDWEEAKAQMLDSRWATQVGRRAEELAETMRTGVE